MKLSELTEQLGVLTYPEELEKFYNKPYAVSICDTKNIEKLDAEYGLFGKYLSPLLECLELVRNNEPLKVYGDLAVSYMSSVTHSEASKIKLPSIEDDTTLRFYPLLILAALMPFGIKKYRARGFSYEEIYNNLNGTFIARIEMAERLNGKQGLDADGYSWLRLYASAMVFRAGIFNITPKKLPHKIVVLRNKLSGKTVILITEGEFHREGAVLGSAGYADTDGSFPAEFTETDEAFFGHEMVNSMASPTLSVYKKSEWEAILRQGDGVAGIHIPRSADMSPDKIRESFRLAMKLSKERYPEFKTKMIHCASWLLDPKLAELLGEDSKIAGFLNCFEKFPIKSDGMSGVFGFVFPKNFNGYENLPEDTTLQRKLKKLYIDGGFIHVFGGIVTDPQMY